MPRGPCSRPEVLYSFHRSGADSEALRRVALEAIGAEHTHPLVPLIARPPAGTVGRSPRPLVELPTEAWEVLRRRQERLPLRHLHRRSDWYAISSNEQRAALRLADRFGLDDDERYSLVHHHHDEVQRRAAEAKPGVVSAPPPPGAVSRPVAGIVHLAGGPRPPLFPRGWVCWFGNRRVNLRAGWLRLTVQR